MSMEHLVLSHETSQNSASRRIWIRFFEFTAVLILLVIGMRPTLTTVVVADDLTGPFTMYSEAGSSLWQNLKTGFNAASNGHFNYLGQTIGGFINWLWLRLMLAGVRYSTIYFFTKLIIFTALVYVSAATAQSIARLWNLYVPPLALRFLIAMTMISTFQLHLVWSNDPVASYPMSGYASVIFGLFAIWAATVFMRNSRSWFPTFMAPVVLLLSILYYEMNIALIPTIAVLAIGYHLLDPSRRKSALPHLSKIAAVYCLPVIFVLLLQKLNAAASASYEGTEVSLTGNAIKTFGVLLISSLPFSSWHLGFDWVDQYPTAESSALLLIPLFILMLVPFRMINQKSDYFHQTIKKLFWIFPPLMTYWIFATLIQSATVKVQKEASRIGNVYNFYAVGSTVFAIIFSIAVLVFLYSAKRTLFKILFLIPLFVASGSQVFLNHAIQQQHFSMLPQTRNLLVSYSERLPIESRCHFLQVWLGMGWPVYYSNSMTTGLERSYQEKFKEPFCGRF